jgi:hypothetical protein
VKKKRKGKREEKGGKSKHSSEWISMQQKGRLFLQIEDSTRETVFFFLFCEGDGSGNSVSQEDPCVRAWTVISDARSKFPFQIRVLPQTVFRAGGSNRVSARMRGVALSVVQAIDGCALCSLCSVCSLCIVGKSVAVDTLHAWTTENISISYGEVSGH